MPNHPGGADYIENNIGKDIKEEFEEAEHTKSALKTLKSLPIVGQITG